jgi:hypothetical protein
MFAAAYPMDRSIMFVTVPTQPANAVARALSHWGDVLDSALCLFKVDALRERSTGESSEGNLVE